MSAGKDKGPGKARTAKRTLNRPYRRGAQSTAGDEYQLLLESNPSPMYVLDTKTLRFLAVNRAAEKQCGWTKAEFLRMTASDILAPKAVRRLRAVLKARRGWQRAFDTLWQHRRQDGSLFDAEVSASVIDFAERPPLLVLITGIPKRKQCEGALRQSEEKSSAAFHTNPAVMAISRFSDGLIIDGSDPAALQVSESSYMGFGLFSLRQRVAMLGGQLEIQSARGAGRPLRARVGEDDPGRRLRQAAAY